MIKHGLGFVLGVAVGSVAFYYAYRWFQENKVNKETLATLNDPDDDNSILDDLLSSQSYVEFLTANELTAWFKSNRADYSDDVKMIIVTPTEKHLKGLGYQLKDEIDPASNIVQLFYDENKSKVLKIRLVNFGRIDANLQAHLIEEDGMSIVTN